MSQRLDGEEKADATATNGGRRTLIRGKAPEGHLRSTILIPIRHTRHKWMNGTVASNEVGLKGKQDE